LLAAFQNRMVGKRLVHALLLLMPGLKYFRCDLRDIAALINTASKHLRPFLIAAALVLF